MRVAIYTRVSTLMQVDGGHSLEGQKRLLQEYAEIKGWEVIGLFEDAGLSGKSAARSKYQEVLQLVNNKQIDAVLVWKISRFSRNFTDLLAIVEIMIKKEVSLISYSEQIDLSSASGKLLFNLLGSVSEFEREQLAENIKMGVVQAVTSGKRSATVCSGYYIDPVTKEFEINAEEAEVIKLIFDSYLKLGVIAEVKNLLDIKGLKGKRGAYYNINTLSIILKNPIYCGYSKLYGKILFKGQSVPPIISVATFDAVQLIFQSKERDNIKHKARTISEWLDL